MRVLDVDLFDRQVIEDPYPLYAALRAHGEPVRSADGHWILCRYDDVRQALVDHGRFSSAETNGATRRRLPVLVGTDPPEHTRLRRLTSKHLVSDTAQTCEPQIERRIEALVAETLEAGRIEAVGDLCAVVPVIALAQLMGVEEEVLAGLCNGSPAQHRIGRRKVLADFFRQARGAACSDPDRRDLLSAVSQPTDTGDVLSEEEFVVFCVLLLAAGVDSVRDLLANLLVELARTPAVWEEVSASPEVLGSVAEEAMRFVSPVQGVFRTATADVGDGAIKGGDRVLLLIGSANRDERSWEDAARLVPRRYAGARPPVAHLGLGSGVHACAGATLARFEVTTVLRQLVQQRAHLTLTGPVVRGRNPYFRTVRRLEMRITT